MEQEVLRLEKRNSAVRCCLKNLFILLISNSCQGDLNPDLSEPEADSLTTTLACPSTIVHYCKCFAVHKKMFYWYYIWGDALYIDCMSEKL
jgi:hypothetical protein